MFGFTKKYEAINKKLEALEKRVRALEDIIKKYNNIELPISTPKKRQAPRVKYQNNFFLELIRLQLGEYQEEFYNKHFDFRYSAYSKIISEEREMNRFELRVVAMKLKEWNDKKIINLSSLKGNPSYEHYAKRILEEAYNVPN